MDIKSLGVKVYCDSADIKTMHEMLDAGLVSGFTCNPTICKKAGVKDYYEFCKLAATEFPKHPLSLEVIAEDANEVARQAEMLSALGDSVYVKVPIVRTDGASNEELIEWLSLKRKMKLNVTCVFTHAQIQKCYEVLSADISSYVSVFAGRIADAGQCPVPYVQHAIHEAEGTDIEVIWASVREPYNVLQAKMVGCHIITVFPEMLKKLYLFGKNLHQFSIDTVKMFIGDAEQSGFKL